jgi:hypothetical protein
MYKVISAESCSGGNTVVSVATNQKSPLKYLLSFSKSFISSGKQGGGVTILRQGCDIVTRETCVATSLNIKDLEKQLCCILSMAGAVPNSACH